MKFRSTFLVKNVEFIIWIILVLKKYTSSLRSWKNPVSIFICSFYCRCAKLNRHFATKCLMIELMLFLEIDIMIQNNIVDILDHYHKTKLIRIVHTMVDGTFLIRHGFEKKHKMYTNIQDTLLLTKKKKWWCDQKF